jgi:hypothetical protein
MSLPQLPRDEKAGKAEWATHSFFALTARRPGRDDALRFAAVRWPIVDALFLIPFHLRVCFSLVAMRRSLRESES